MPVMVIGGVLALSSWGGGVIERLWWDPGTQSGPTHHNQHLFLLKFSFAQMAMHKRPCSRLLDASRNSSRDQQRLETRELNIPVITHLVGSASSHPKQKPLCQAPAHDLTWGCSCSLCAYGTHIDKNKRDSGSHAASQL